MQSLGFAACFDTTAAGRLEIDDDDCQDFVR